MQSNLDKLFKNDKNSESGGIWMEVSEEIKFLVKRFGGFNSQPVKMALAKYYKPYARQVETGTLSADKEREIQNRVFVESCMLDWKGVQIDGQEVPFSKEEAVKLLNSLPELADTLVNYANDPKNYREDLGNS